MSASGTHKVPFVGVNSRFMRAELELHLPGQPHLIEYLFRALSEQRGTVFVAREMGKILAPLLPARTVSRRRVEHLSVHAHYERLREVRKLLDVALPAHTAYGQELYFKTARRFGVHSTVHLEQAEAMVQHQRILLCALAMVTDLRGNQGQMSTTKTG